MLKDLVAKYSQFINFPIYLYSGKEVEVSVVILAWWAFGGGL